MSVAWNINNPSEGEKTLSTYRWCEIYKYSEMWLLYTKKFIKWNEKGAINPTYISSSWYTNKNLCQSHDLDDITNTLTLNMVYMTVNTRNIKLLLPLWDGINITIRRPSNFVLWLIISLTIQRMWHIYGLVLQLYWSITL